MYYLETNAIITLNNNLPIYRKNSFTSALSIFELISGLNEKNFRIRKKALVNIYHCELPIVWFLPESITSDAFPYKNLKYEDFRIPGLKVLCQGLLKYDDFEEFKQNTNNLKHNFDYFQNADNQYSKRFIDSTVDLNEKLKEILLKEQEENGDWFAEFGREFIKSIPSNHSLNISMTLDSIASNIVDGAELATGQKIEKSDVRLSYNGSIETFIKAFSFFVGQKSAEIKSPAKNDFFDLHHLLYLGNNPSYYIISNDKMLSTVTKQIISIENFKQIANGW